MPPSEEELRQNGISYLSFLREHVVRNIAQVESGEVPHNWSRDVPLPPEILPLLHWRREQIDRVLEHYRSGKPFDQAPPLLVGSWAEGIDGSEDEETTENDH